MLKTLCAGNPLSPLQHFREFVQQHYRPEQVEDFYTSEARQTSSVHVHLCPVMVVVVVLSSEA